MEVKFNNKVVNLKLENGVEVSVNASSGSIVAINGEEATGHITGANIVAGKFKGKRLWFDFLYLMIENLMLAGSEIFQHSSRPNVYLIGNKEAERSAVVGFHFIEK